MEHLFVFVYVGVCVCVCARSDEGAALLSYFFVLYYSRVSLFVILRVCCSLEDPTNFSNRVCSADMGTAKIYCSHNDEIAITMIYYCVTTAKL